MSMDMFGPEYIIKVYDPKIKMEGFLVIDNTTLGPGKGGVRMTPNISEEEVFRLARAMTWKNALANLPFGGAKAGIIWPGGADELKKNYIQSFARAIKFFTPKKYIAGPDVNTGEKEMQWFVEATGNLKSATGKPKKMGGLPHELGGAGFGIAQAVKVAAESKGIDIKKATIAIEGFGNVGGFAFKFLKQLGGKIAAVADSRGTALINDNNNFNEEALLKLKSQGKSVVDYPNSQKLSHDDIFGLPVDILILATVTDVINESNMKSIRAKIIVEGANIPMKEEIEEKLFKKGILIVPDFVANAGGVISSYAEYRGYNPKRMFEIVEMKIKKNVKAVLEESIRSNQSPRAVALGIAKNKLKKEMLRFNERQT